jgi:hypothetical protein
LENFGFLYQSQPLVDGSQARLDLGDVSFDAA